MVRQILRGFFKLQTRRRSLAAGFARVVLISSPSGVRGRGEGREPAGTRGPLCETCAKQMHSGIQVKPGHPGLPCAVVGTAYVVISPGRRALLPPSPGGLLTRSPGWPKRTTTRLDASCGRQDHTILPYADSAGRLRDCNRSRSDPPCDLPIAPTPPASTAAHPAYRDDRDPPL